MNKILDVLQRCRQAGRDVVLVTILDDKGSAPRGAGAVMLVGAQGRLAGTIGGGAVEFEAERLALTALAEQRTFTKEYHLSRDLGMICGGEVLVEFRYVAASDPAPTEALIRTDPITRVLIFGGGHVAQALVPVLARLDFNCWVMDDRPELCEARLFPGAKKVLQINYEDISPYVQILPDDYVVVMTHGHAADYIVQRQAMRHETAYIGVIGSRNKIRTIAEKLAGDGFSAEAIAAVHAPIGIFIKAETPDEIAVSIAAELIRVRAETRGK